MNRMNTFVDYRVSISGGEMHLDDGVKHERVGEEGIRVSLFANRLEVGKKAETMDMRKSTAESTFNSNYESWTAANAMSSTSNLDNAYFNEIVKMGKDAVPYIYKELLKGPTDLVYALDAIFDYPIKYDGFVSLKKSREIWLSILQRTGKF